MHACAPARRPRRWPRCAGSSHAPPLAEALPLLRRAVAGCDAPGRVMAAANRDLWPVVAADLGPDGLAEAWQATTTLREHRGDGHVAALVVHGLARGGGPSAGRRHQGDRRPRSCGTTEGGARRSGTPRRLPGCAVVSCSADGRATDAGRTLHGEVEALTDRLAAPAYRDLERRRSRRPARRAGLLRRRRRGVGAPPVPQPDGLAPSGSA